MATKPIKGSEIIEVGALDNHISQLKELKTLYETLDKDVLKFATESKKAAKGFKASNNEDVKRAIQLEKQLTAEIVEQEKRERAKIQTEKTLLTLSKAKQNMSARTKKAIADENNAYKQQSKTLTDLINRYQNLAARGRENGKVARGLLTEITKLDTGLKKIDATVGRHQRNVGNYSSAFSNLGNSLKGISLRFIGVTALIMGLGRVMTGAFNVFKNFNQETANLAAVLGKTRAEIKPLTDDAKRLGASTKFTASEVTRMQVAFSKLGFKEKEILNATEATLSLAAATGTELEEAAEVAAATLNGFGLEADQTQRVVDVMAKSFSTSALDMEKFKVAMRAVGPVAKTAGFTIERTTALLGVLADNGVRAETAGTGLRNVFLELSKRGITFEEAMSKIANSSDKAATSMELFGKENAVVGVVLSENVEKTNELEKALKNAGGSAEEMANTQLDTLSGATTRLSSAWEGFILALEDGDGVIAKVIRGAIDLTTELITALTDLSLSAKQIEERNLGRTKDFAKSTVDSDLKRIKELQELSNADLEREFYTSDSPVIPMQLLKLREKGATMLEQELFILLEKKNIQRDVLHDIEDEIESRGELWGQFSRATKEEIESMTVKKGIMEQTENLAKSSIQKATQEELLQIIEREYLFRLQGEKTGMDMVKLAELELKRREDIKKNEIELNDEKKKGADSNEKQLTGLAKLEKELADLEKKRSDYLVDNKGVVDEEFIRMTGISRELKEQIDSLREKLKLEQEEVEKKDDFPERLKKIQDEEAVAEAYRQRQLTAEQKELDDLANRLSDELLLAGDNNELKLKLEEEYQKNKAEIEKKYADARQKELDDVELKKQQEKLEAQKQIAQNLTDLTVMLANRRIEALERENQIQQQIFEQSMNREQQIIAMREANNSSIEDSLAFEKEAQAKALQEQSKIAKKKARIEMFMNGMQLLNSYVQQGKGVGNVIGDMTALTSALEQIVPAFWTGTDTTVGDAVGVKYSNKRDGVLARIDPSEMVLNKTKVDTLAKYGVNSTDDIVRRVQMGSMFNVPSVTSSKPIVINDVELLKSQMETNALLQQIAQKPTSQLDIEQLDRLITISETISTPTKRTTTIKHKRLGR